MCAVACVDVGTQTPSCSTHMAVSLRVVPNGIVLTHHLALARASVLSVHLLFFLDEPTAAIDASTVAGSANAVGGSNPAQRDVWLYGGRRGTPGLAVGMAELIVSLTRAACWREAVPRH